MPIRLLDWIIDENEIFQAHTNRCVRKTQILVGCGYLLYSTVHTYGDSRGCGSLLYILAPGGLYKEPPAISPLKPDGEIEEDGSQLGLRSASISFKQLWNPEHLESSNNPLLSPQSEITLGRMACQ